MPKASRVGGATINGTPHTPSPDDVVTIGLLERLLGQLGFPVSLAGTAGAGAPSVALASTSTDLAAVFAATSQVLPTNARNALTGWYHADSYGATFDGVTDDRVAIAAAITAAQAAGGGTVYLKPGTTRVSNGASASAGCVNVSGNGVEVRGAGKGVTIIKLLDNQDTSSDVTGIIRTASGVQQTGVTFRDLTVDGNKAGNTSVSNHVIGFFAGVTPNSTNTDRQIRCINVEIKNCSGYGFDPHERITGLVLDHCESHDNSLDGFTLDGQYDAVVSGCLAWNNGRHGFNVVTASADCTLTDCHAWSNTTNGLTIQQGSKRITVSGGSYHDNTGDGILVNGVAMTGQQQDLTPGVANKLTGTHVYKNGDHGVELTGATYNHITGCTILDNSQTTTNTSNGIYLNESGTDYSTFNRIVGNTVRSSTTPAHKYSIREKTSNSDNNFLLGNVLSGAATANLSLLGATSLTLAAHNGVNEHPVVTAYTPDSPSKHGYLEWNYDPVATGSGSGQVATSGTVYLQKVTAVTGGTASNIVVNIGTVGNTLTTGQNLAALYSSSGSQLAITGDQTTAWAASTGVKVMAFSGAATVALTAGTDYYVVLLSVGSTPAAFVRAGATGVATANGGLATVALRFAVNGTAQTALSTLTMSSNTSTGALTYWVALS